MTAENKGSVIDNGVYLLKKEASSTCEFSSRPSFLEVIGRKDLAPKITERNPWAYFSMEIGLPGLELSGGLGVLAGDTIGVADKVGMPITGVTLGYPIRWRQRLENHRQKEDFSNVAPDPEAKHMGHVYVKANNETTLIDVSQKRFGENASVIELSEPGLGDLYNGKPDDEHRAWQQTVLCVGGIKALDMLGYDPAFVQLNESAMVFSAVSYLDNLCKNGVTLEEAKERQAKKTILTNHSLVPAAVATFPEGYFERYLLENVSDEKVKGLVRDLIKKNIDHRLNLSELAFELSDKQNGVSIMHAQIASESFRKLNGEKVCFEPVTNGINLERWAKEYYLFDQESGITDRFQLPAENYSERIEELDSDKQLEVKREAKKDLLEFLQTRVDQYGGPVQIPEDVKIVTWARRFAGYKRPGMLFSDPERLANILEEENMHIVLAGKTHPGDDAMKDEMQRILTLAQNNPRLSQRIHFVQDYDEPLGKHLVAGSDIWINTPIKGKEACGTSWMKAVANRTLLISTEDGGVADVSNGHYFRIEGNSEWEEIESLYRNLKTAGQMVDNNREWDYKVKDQLKAYLPVICGGRMIKDYLNFEFPQINN